MALSILLRRAAMAAAAGLVLFAHVPCAAAGQGGGPGSGSQLPLVLQPLKSDIVIAPDFRVTKLNGSTGDLAGGYVGWLMEDTLMVGGGAYWLTNGSSGQKLAYGGVVAQLRMNGDQPIAFGAKILVGAGEVTLTENSTITIVRPMHIGDLPVPPTVINQFFRIRDNFLVAEPELDLLMRVTDRVHLNWGVSYRAIGRSDGLQKQLQGAAGSVSLQFAVGK